MDGQIVNPKMDRPVEEVDGQMGIQPALMAFPETQSPPVVDIVSGRCCYNSTLGTEGLL